MQEVIKDKDGDIVPESLIPQEEDFEEEAFQLQLRENSISSIEQKLHDIDKVFQYHEKIMNYCLKKINKSRVLQWGENPYLGEAAINPFRGPMGLYEKNVNIWFIKADGSKLNINDPHAFQGDTIKFLITGIIGSKVLNVEAMFEGGRDAKDLGQHKKDDVLFFIKAMRANWFSRGTRKLLGLDSISWEELLPYGIKKEDCKKIELQSADKAPTGESEEIWKMLLELTNNNIVLAEKKCEEMTGFKGRDGNMIPGKKKPSYLSSKQIEILKPKLQKEIEALRKTQATEPKAEPKMEKPAETPVNGNLKFKTSAEAISEIKRLTKTKPELQQKAKDLMDEYDIPNSAALGAYDIKFLNQFIEELSK